MTCSSCTVVEDVNILSCLHFPSKFVNVVPYLLPSAFVMSDILCNLHFMFFHFFFYHCSCLSQQKKTKPALFIVGTNYITKIATLLVYCRFYVFALCNTTFV